MAPTWCGLANFTGFPAPGVVAETISLSDIFTKSCSYVIRITSTKFSKVVLPYLLIKPSPCFENLLSLNCGAFPQILY